MASTINASTSPAAIVQTADGTANLSLQSNGTTIAALTSTGMAVTGTISASGVITATGGLVVGATAAPAFSAYANTAQTITSNVFTKIQFNTEEFDTNSNYDNATNYRFTPTVAGYYQVQASVLPNTTTTQTAVGIYKNGASFKFANITAATVSAVTTALISMNGTTDYLEGYAYLVGTTPAIAGNQAYTYFQASMVRSA